MDFLSMEYFSTYGKKFLFSLGKTSYFLLLSAGHYQSLKIFNFEKKLNSNVFFRKIFFKDFFCSSLLYSLSSRGKRISPRFNHLKAIRIDQWATSISKQRVGGVKKGKRKMFRGSERLTVQRKREKMFFIKDKLVNNCLLYCKRYDCTCTRLILIKTGL